MPNGTLTLFTSLAWLMGALSLPLGSAPWLEVNDGVMGGVSSSQMRNEEGFLVFTGHLSLENNGGFASARRGVNGLPAETDRIRIEVRGDGRRYQFRIRQDVRFDGIAWSQSFATAETWQSIELPLESFTPVFRGMRVGSAGPVEAGRVRQVGFLLADKSPGPFRLEIRSIEFLAEEQGGDERD